MILKRYIDNSRIDILTALAHVVRVKFLNELFFVLTQKWVDITKRIYVPRRRR